MRERGVSGVASFITINKQLLNTTEAAIFLIQTEHPGGCPFSQMRSTMKCRTQLV